MKIKNICCIGAGYVGGPTMAVIALKCKDILVNVVDINLERINAWNNKDLTMLPIYEPGLDQIIKKCRNKNLFFSNDLITGIKNADMIFISVNTPTKSQGIGAGEASDLRWIELSARQIAENSTGHTIVVEKSTLPVRTAETIKNILESQNKTGKNKGETTFSVLSNPEFLAEGTAINNLINPDRVLIGGDDDVAIDKLGSIYERWINPKKIIKTNLWSSELSKLTANAFLAQRVSSINSISAICESSGANIKEVTKAIGMDSRIGANFLQSGPGFGGSCFKKDILNIIYLCNFYGLNEVADYWSSVLKINRWQQKRISKTIIEKLFNTIAGKKISILGFAYKANTNDTRESPAISIAKDLLNEDALLAIYDPKVSAKQITKDLDSKQLNEKQIFKKNSGWYLSKSINETFNGADAIIILTDWEEFKKLNLKEISNLMRKPAWIFDTRNLIDLEKKDLYGINIWSLGNT